ncbi:uncharacterized protein LOC108213909 [Daucus carota subsp. sativus]|uniref:uncharacterized protein LOC108213909 n=1 Tax=Daucus carota subsp. sativus TaxID=79200 RepID=UPI003083B8E3
MDLSGVIIEKFIKCLTTADLESDEMKLPAKIISKYGDIIPKCLLLKFLNGYQIPVMRNEEKGTLSGLSTVYADFDLKAGEMLVFQFDGSSNFNVYVIGTDLLEIEYPCVVHHFQRTPPRNGMPSTVKHDTSLDFYVIVYLTVLIYKQLIFFLLC